VRVLVVEDDARLAAALSRGLGAEGFSVQTCRDGVTAVWMATEHDFDVITLDLMLPGLSGYRVCEQLRAAGVDTPVLMLTARDGEHEEADAFDLGVDDFLSKPFSFLVLVARLRSLVRRGRSGGGARLAVGELSLDTAAHRCRLGGTEVALTPREFSLLEYLMHNAGRVVSKGQLLEHVWDALYAGDPNVVEVYVGYLRRKLSLPGATARIETVRGCGYRLVAEPAAAGAPARAQSSAASSTPSANPRA
jgi:two-component system OmpR family response regulator